MANIPIWPGSSSFTTGSTPFGFYDTDVEFQVDADKVSNFCARRLGYPLVEVELQDISFYAAFEEAITTYGNTIYSYKIQQDYLDVLKDLMGTKLGLKKRNPTKKEQEELKKSTAKLNKILNNIELKKATKNKNAAAKVIAKLERNKKLIKEGFEDEVELLTPEEKKLYTKAVEAETIIRKKNTGGLVGLKQKKSFIPKIIQNKSLREKRQNKKPKGVGASLRGWGAVSG